MSRWKSGLIIKLYTADISEIVEGVQLCDSNQKINKNWELI